MKPRRSIDACLDGAIGLQRLDREAAIEARRRSREFSKVADAADRSADAREARIADLRSRGAVEGAA